MKKELLEKRIKQLEHDIEVYMKSVDEFKFTLELFRKELKEIEKLELVNTQEIEYRS